MTKSRFYNAFRWLLLNLVSTKSKLILVAFLFLISPLTHASFNEQINYQGRLTTPAGYTIPDSTYTIIFSLYSSSSGGAALWTETKSVTTSHGLFSVMLGSNTPFPANIFDQTPLYLGVKIGSDPEMTPRKQVGSVPSSITSKYFDGLATTSFLRADTVNATGTINHLNLNTLNIGALSGPLVASSGVISAASLSSNYLAKWNGSTFVDSQIQDDGTDVTIGSDFVVAPKYGQLWSYVQSSPRPDGYEDGMYGAPIWVGLDISADGSKQVAVTSEGLIYKSVNYGNTWTLQASTAKLYSGVSISSDALIQTAVAYNDYIYISSDSGSTWEARGSIRHWHDIAITADGNFQIAVGGDSYPGNEDVLGGYYISSDGGDTWSENSPTSGIKRVAMSADGNYILMAPNYAVLQRSTNQGATWTGIPGMLAHWDDVAISSDGSHQVAVGDLNLYVSTNYGVDWTIKGAETNWESVDISADGKYITAISESEIYVSSDEGNTWKLAGAIHNVYGAIAMSASGRYQTIIDMDGTLVSSNRSYVGLGTNQPSVELEVVGTASSSNLYVNGSATSGALAVLGDTTIGGQVNIDGFTTINNGLSVLNEIQFADMGSLTAGQYLYSSLGWGFGDETSPYYINNNGVGNLGGLTISSAVTPVIFGSLTQVSTSTTSSPRNIAVCGNYTYAVNQTQNSLVVIDTTNKAAPVVVGATTTNLSVPYGVACDGSYAYVASFGNSRLVIFDVTTPSSPTYFGQLTGISGAQDITVSGNYAYISGTGFFLANVTDRTSPTLASSISSVSTGSGCRGVTKSGNYAYMACEGASFRDAATNPPSLTDGAFDVIDVSNPLASSISSRATGAAVIGDARDVAVIGTNAYVTSLTGWLTVYDVSNPAVISTTTSYALGDETNQVLQTNTPNWIYPISNTYGDYVVVQNVMSYKSQIVDVTTPATPSIEKEITLNGQGWGVFVDTNYLYLAHSNQSTDGKLYIYSLQSIFAPNIMTILGRQIGQDLEAYADALYSIGSASLRYLNAYIKNIYATLITTTNLVATNATSTNLAASTLAVTGTSTMRDIIPDMTGASILSPYVSIYSLGASTTRWKSLWVEDLYIGTSTWKLSQGNDGGLFITNLLAGATTSLSSAGSGSSQWTTNDSSIYYGSGNVGIGTSSPIEELALSGTLAIKAKTGVDNTWFSAYNSSGTLVSLMKEASNQGRGGLSFTGRRDGLDGSGVVFNGLVNNDNGSERAAIEFNGAKGSIGSSLSALTNTPIAIFCNNTLGNVVTAAECPVVINSNGYIGVGTTSPEYKLTVVGEGSGTSMGALAAYTYSDTATDRSMLYLGRARGTPTARSNVQNGDTVGGIQSNGLSGSTFYNNTKIDFIVDGTFTSGLRPPGAIILSTAAANSSGATEAMRITSAGYVGIGTVAPFSKLNVSFSSNDTSFANTEPAYQALLSNTDTTNGNMVLLGFGQQDTSASVAIGAVMTDHTPGTRDADLVFINMVNNSVSEKMRLFGNNLGIGTSSPTAMLTVSGTTRLASLGSGAVQSDAIGNLTVSSDIKLKDVSGSFTRGLSDLLGLEPIRYHWNATSGMDMVNEYVGFSAQNVQLFIPEAVGTSSTGFLTLSDRPILAAVINSIKELASSTVRVGEDIVWRFKEIYTNTIEVKRGVILYDEQTGEPYCLTISGGVTKTTPGKCETVVNNAPVIVPPLIIDSSSGSTTPPVSGGDATSTSVIDPPSLIVATETPATTDQPETGGDESIPPNQTTDEPTE